jgi:hypothetical protein
MKQKTKPQAVKTKAALYAAEKEIMAGGSTNFLHKPKAAPTPDMDVQDQRFCSPWSARAWGETIEIRSEGWGGIAWINPRGKSDLGIPSRADRKTAALIVRAVNSHDALVAALKALSAWHDHPALTGLPDGSPVADWAPSFDETVNMVHAALLAAGEEI